MSAKPEDVIPEEAPLLPRTEAGDALFLLLRAHRLASDGMDQRLRDDGELSLAAWEVLVVLSRAPDGRMRMSDITARMLVSKSNTTKLVDQLEQGGLVERSDSTSDRRVVYARLTADGIEALKRGSGVFNQGADELIRAHMTATETRAMTSGLSKMIAALTSTHGIR
jgi:DNA-binding MarR family transcriptional regulator